MTRVLLIGGHGKVARLTSPLLTAAGHDVDAVIRNPAQADDVQAAGARPVVADVETLDTGALIELVRGHDVVVWSAGAGGGDPARTYAVDRDAACRSMDAAAAVGVDHYVMISYFGAATDHGVAPESSFFPYAEAKAEADEHLREIALPWTVLGPSGLTLDAPTGHIEIGGTAGSVSRGNVAAVIAEVVARGPLWATVRFNDGPTAIAAALDAVTPDA